MGQNNCRSKVTLALISASQMADKKHTDICNHKTSNMKRTLALAPCLLIVLTACHTFFGHRIKGNGNVIVQNRDISGFSGVDVSGAIHVYVKQDSAFSVKIETDENLQEYVLASEDHGILHIRREGNTRLDATGKIKVYVSAPVFNSLAASGACEIVGENQLMATGDIDIDVSGASNARLNMKAPKITAGMSGASHLALKGETRDFYIKGSGVSHAQSFDLLSENAYVDVSGASSAEVFASVTLDADASGASDIRYKGVAKATAQKSGGASITKVD